MKKFLMILAFASVSMASMAQEDPTLKYSVATNSFWQNWFVQVNASWNAFYSNEEKGADFAKGPFKDFRSAPGFSVAVGKWFTPGLGLRTKFAAMNGRSVISENKDANDIKFWNLQEQALFNLSNMFCGYSDTRTWNFVPFLSAGLIRNFNANTISPMLGVGIENTWRFGKHFGLYLDVDYKMVRNDFILSVDRGYEDKAISHGILSAELGVMFYLGSATFAKAVTIDQYNALAAASEEALAKLRADLDRERQINADLRAQLAKQPKAVAETKVISAGTSVFFDINSTKINSKKDLVNLESVATVAKNTGSKILVTGSADSKTGSAAWNQQLSEGRAQAVADELVNLGVSRDKIETKAVGGINEVSPYTLNRRALVELK